MRVVVDTNVVVSGLLVPTGKPGRILDLLLMRRLIALFDDRILDEYHRVVARTKLRLDPVKVDTVLGFIEREGLAVSAPPLRIDLPDPDDLAFLEVAVAGDAGALITGNGRHFAQAGALVSVRVVTPAEFLDLWLDHEEPGA